MALNSVRHDGIPASRHPRAAASTAAPLDQAKRPAHLMIPRRIDVIKNHQTPDTFLRMEVDDATTYMVPIGPKLVAALIKGLERSQRMVAPPSLKQ